MIKFIIFVFLTSTGLSRIDGRSDPTNSNNFNPIALRLLEYQIEKLQVLVDELEVNVTREIEECNCNETLANLTEMLGNVGTENARPPASTEIVSENQNAGQIYQDCHQIYEAGFIENGVYEIWVPNLFDYLLVFCDMETQSHSIGWITILNRFNGTTYFSRDFIEFETGFGSPFEEFWIGLDNIYQLTRNDGSNKVNVSVRFDVEDLDGVKAYAQYERFRINDSDNDYAITEMSNFTGNATDISVEVLDQTFQAQDQNNLNACIFKGGFWLRDCESANINAPYPANLFYQETYKMEWPGWASINPNNPDLKSVSMKIQIHVDQ